jgi:hypothetical protein
MIDKTIEDKTIAIPLLEYLKKRSTEAKEASNG